ncbi:phosphoribosylamine--glycine ligase [Chloroflexota bacterium]
MLKVLVIGSGAREHTLVWKIAQSPRVKEIFVAPGNAGTAQLAHNVAIDATDIEALNRFAREKKIDLTVVGPEAPLAAGIVGRFSAGGLAVFGASRAAAEIESSKVFAKQLLEKYHIPAARSVSFTDYREAKAYLQQQKPPIVVKADGLAAGKGVVVAASIAEALEALERFMREKTLGAAGNKVLVEECLVGKEMSTFVFTDGHTVVPMVPACDYKRVTDGDRGPNTGGMGSYSPPPFFDASLGRTVQETIMSSTVNALHAEGRPYTGVLYGGLMITNNRPKVLEFNARFGDPETQVVLPRLQTDLVEVMEAVIENRLDRVKIDWIDNACVGVVLASGGYPGNYQTGFPIGGLDEIDEDVMVFHAGTKKDASGQVLTSGGRVLTVVAAGKDLAEARGKVYANVRRLHFKGCQYRNDIAEIKE